MRSIPVVVLDVVASDDLEMLLVEHKHVVETFPAQQRVFNKQVSNSRSMCKWHLLDIGEEQMSQFVGH